MNRTGIIFIKITDSIAIIEGIILGIYHEFFNSHKVTNFNLVPVKVKR